VFFGLAEALESLVRSDGLLDVRNYRIATMSGYSKSWTVPPVVVRIRNAILGFNVL